MVVISHQTGVMGRLFLFSSILSLPKRVYSPDWYGCSCP